MMKVLEVAAQLIEDAGLATQGDDLFIGTLPADVAHGVMLKMPFDPAAVDDGMTDFYDTEFQVIVRDLDEVDGYNKCFAIAQALRQYRLQANDRSISWMRPKTLPISYPRGEADDIESSCRIAVGFGIITP